MPREREGGGEGGREGGLVRCDEGKEKINYTYLTRQEQRPGHDFTQEQHHYPVWQHNDEERKRREGRKEGGRTAPTYLE